MVKWLSLLFYGHGVAVVTNFLGGAVAFVTVVKVKLLMRLLLFRLMLLLDLFPEKISTGDS